MVFEQVARIVLCASLAASSLAASGPAITAVSHTPAAPTASDSVWVTSSVTSSAGISQVTLTYSSGVGGGVGQTNPVFQETMAASNLKPWTGTGCDHAWSVAYAGSKSPFAQSGNANYGGGNTNGCEFKGNASTTVLADNTVACLTPMDARGSSGFVEFWLETVTMSGAAGWAFQLNSGSGFVTRTNEEPATSHAWRLYHYDLQPGDLVSNLLMRFQFQSDPAATNNRIYLDQLSVKTITAGPSASRVPMLDDGLHQDGAAGDGVYGGQIPALPAGTIVGYCLTATDSGGLSTTNPVGAPAILYAYTVAANPQPDLYYNVLLGRPTDQSIALSVLSSNDLEVYVAYGLQPGVYSSQTATQSAAAGTPAVFDLQPLTPNQKYYYCLYYRLPGSGLFSAGADRSFHTQRVPGDTFTFIIEADPHYLDNEPPVWQHALTNMLADNPDFLIDLGDTFMGEKYYSTNSSTLSQAGIYEASRTVRNEFFSLAGHSIPLFLVNGNHDPELGWFLSNAQPTNNPPVWADSARELNYPCPIPGGFYSGSTNADPYLGGGARDAYYAFQWGDALFVMLDNFWYSWQGVAKSGDHWAWTLGASQYQWLKRTLETSHAKYKFVFAHHLVGGSFAPANLNDARGGMTSAPYFEWGGFDTNGVYAFEAHRPGWGLPIQSLLLSNGVNAFFHGHDHLFVKEDLDINRDGQTDLVYQECPQPSRTNYNATSAAVGYGYTNATALQGNSGYLRVTVSSTNTTVEYVRVYLPADEGPGKTNRMVTYSYAVSAPGTVVPLSGSIVLGRPTDHSITVSILASNDAQIYVEYGSTPGVYPLQTALTNLTAGSPLEVLLTPLTANTRYYYRLRYKGASDPNYLADAMHTFITQRPPGSTFTFSIQGDSHPERTNNMYDPNFYRLTLNTAASDQPDFYLCIGDDFSVDNIPTNQISAGAVAYRYTLQRPYLGLIGHSAPLFLVNGNHEQAATYLLDGTSNNIAVWAQNARNQYYPEPAPDGFYSGNTNPVPFIGLLRNYYAWTWGDALFVTLDPYWGSSICVDDPYWGGPKRSNLWDVTHGDPQYEWLKQILEQSHAKYKFVFAHHVLGTGRGGTDEAGFYEWGGQNGNGTWGFTANRPAWTVPIHQLMAANNVTAFIQGHDHIFVRQQLDGVTYQTLPNPADSRYSLFNADAYVSDLIYKTNNSGYARFTVSPSGVRVDYVRTILPANLLPPQVATNGAPPGMTNGTVGYSYVILPLTIAATIHTPVAPAASDPVWVTTTVAGGANLAQVTLTYIVGTITNTVPMLDDGAHHDGAAGDDLYGGLIPALPLGANVLYYVHAVDAATRQFTDPSGAPFNPNLYSYTVGGARPLLSGSLLPDGKFRLQFATTAGSVYAIQAADFLTNPIRWTTLLTTNPGLNMTVLFDDPQTTNHPQRFYRTVSQVFRGLNTAMTATARADH